MSRSIWRPTLVISIIVVAAFALAACGGSAAATSNKPVEVQVTLTEMKIASSLTEFSTGVPYHFVVTDKGTVAHQFAIMPPVEGQISLEQLHTKALAAIDEIPVGATKTLDYTFTQPAPSGTLEFACHLPGHYEAGMRLPIVVK